MSLVSTKGSAVLTQNKQNKESLQEISEQFTTEAWNNDCCSAYVGQNREAEGRLLSWTAAVFQWHGDGMQNEDSLLLNFSFLFRNVGPRWFFIITPTGFSDLPNLSQNSSCLIIVLQPWPCTGALSKLWSILNMPINWSEQGGSRSESRSVRDGVTVCFKVRC